MLRVECLTVSACALHSRGAISLQKLSALVGEDAGEWYSNPDSSLSEFDDALRFDPGHGYVFQS